MKWEQIERDWKIYKPQVTSQWSRLTDEHLNAIGGKREKLASKVQEVYAVSKEEAEKQIKGFEERAMPPQAATAATKQPLADTAAAKQPHEATIAAMQAQAASAASKQPQSGSAAGR